MPEVAPQTNMHERRPALANVAQFIGASSCKLKVFRFDFRSGHISRVTFQPPPKVIEVHRRGNRMMFLSPSLPIPSPLLKSISMSLGEDKKERQIDRQREGFTKRDRDGKKLKAQSLSELNTTGWGCVGCLEVTRSRESLDLVSFAAFHGADCLTILILCGSSQSSTHCLGLSVLICHMKRLDWMTPKYP